MGEAYEQMEKFQEAISEFEEAVNLSGAAPFNWPGLVTPMPSPDSGKRWWTSLKSCSSFQAAHTLQRVESPKSTSACPRRTLHSTGLRRRLHNTTVG